jgi:hypothetical protein
MVIFLACKHSLYTLLSHFQQDLSRHFRASCTSAVGKAAFDFHVNDIEINLTCVRESEARSVVLSTNLLNNHFRVDWTVNIHTT